MVNVCVFCADGSLEHVCNPLQLNILGVLYGHAIGDAIGLLTEFLSKADAQKVANLCLVISSYVRLYYVPVNKLDH